MVIVALQATTQATGNKKAHKHWVYRLLKCSTVELIVDWIKEINPTVKLKKS